MRAICATASRALELRDVPKPEVSMPGHLIVQIDSATIMPGDKFFLTHPQPNGSMRGGRYDVYGANGAGTVVAVGQNVPEAYIGKKVCVYVSYAQTPEMVGMWCEFAHVPYQSCLILPDHVRIRDYTGSFANLLTVYAFLSLARDDGHEGVIVTAGTSATGLIAASLVRRRNIPAIFLVRSPQARDVLLGFGAEHVLVTAERGFQDRLSALAARLDTTAVFDGVGGELLSRTLPSLPMGSTIYVYGLVGGATPAEVTAELIISHKLTLRHFSSLETPTVEDPVKRAAAIRDIETLIDDRMFKTRIGQEFSFEQFQEAIAYNGPPGARAVLVA